MTFYTTALGMTRQNFGAFRVALHFGSQKINLHQAGAELTPHAQSPTKGSADVCLITRASIEEIVDHLNHAKVEIELGPVARMGAIGVMQSVYRRDPDQNLVEVSTYS